MKNTGLTLNEVVNKFKSSGFFLVRVPHNPAGEGCKQTLLAKVTYHNGEGTIDTIYGDQSNINGVDYAFGLNWRHEYKGTFDAFEFTEMIPKEEAHPTPYKEGDTVIVQDTIREIGNYKEWKGLGEMCIGNQTVIIAVFDTSVGVYYHLEMPNDTISGMKIQLPHAHLQLVKPVRTANDVLNNLSEEDKQIIINSMKK